MIKKMVVAALILTSSLQAEVKVLALAGSTREDSCNKKLANEAGEIAKQMGATVTVLDLKDYDIPLYNGDLEAKSGMPVDVKKLRKLMIENDAFIIASPEYNGSLPAMLKNVIDWMTRSEDGKPSRDVFNKKKIAIMSCSPGAGGGARGLGHLRTILENIGAQVVTNQVALGESFKAFNNEGLLINQKAKEELTQEVKQLLQ